MSIFYNETVSPESKMRSPDRILELSIIDGTKPKDSLGMVDPRLLKDGPDKNRIHIVMDTHSSLWSIRYEKGAVPQPLQGQYTGFKQARDHCERYFASRNIKITDVKD